ncbi:MAG: HesA/MoeB/ThiF family protein [Planctomycetaceae bacterium]|nr:HesA/MoeB/ThiF family protein [Planctomycetaceae bacterium]
MTSDSASLTELEQKRYEWQMWSPQCGEAGQLRLKNATVLISRVGGVGGSVAMALAAAGVGRLILAHAGPLRLDDLNRQLLMKTDAIGSSRVACAAERLREINPLIDVVEVPENMNSENADRWIAQADLVIDAAPLFEERFAMNAAAVRNRKPLIECAMYDFSARIVAVVPGQTACLRCIYPEQPEHWKRQFPVFAAVSSLAGSLAATEALKLLLGTGSSLAGQILTADLLTMTFRKLPVERSENCPVCRTLSGPGSSDWQFTKT